MKFLREILADADSRRVAVGHFNISELAALKGIFAAAQEISEHQKIVLPIIIGVSEGEREFVGVPQAVALVSSLRKEYDYPIFLNADHTHSLDKVKIQTWQNTGGNQTIAGIDGGIPYTRTAITFLQP